MDKYEYNLKFDQIKSLCAEENYDAAAEIADTINWNKIRNINALVKAGEVYEKVQRYEESKEILLMAYERSPIGRMIIYRLAEIAIKMGSYDEAEEYYNEFVQIAPHDTLKYVLRYKIIKARGGSYTEQIPVLEQLKEQEYTEEWSYELAYLYHKAGMIDKCVEACDELILWFGDGPYVERALELKMLYQPLTKTQEEKYRLFRLTRDGVTVIAPEEMELAGEFGHAPVNIPQVSLNAEKFNTVNLQEEIAKGIQQIMDATEKETVSDTMDNIKKIVEDIPYLSMPREEEKEEPENHIETDEEIDGSLRMNFQELLNEEADGQISMVVDEQSQLERQITGQMTIADVLEEWERTKRAAETALQEAEKRKLESAKARALQEAGDIMDRLTGVIPVLDAGTAPVELPENEYMAQEPVAESDESRPVIVPEISDESDEMFDTKTELERELDQAVSAEPESEDNSDADLDLELEAAVEEPLAEAEPEAEPELEREPEEEIVPENTGFSFPVEEEPEVSEEEDAPLVAIVSAGMQELHPTEDIPVDEIKAAIEEPAEPEPIAEPEVIAEAIEEPEKSADSVEEPLRKRTTSRLPDINLSGTGPMPKVAEEALPEVGLPEDILADLASEALENTEEAVEAEEKKTVISHLTTEQRAIFSYFVPVKGMEDQLCSALTGAISHVKSDNTAKTGNLIIQGGRGCGKTVLATSMIKVIQKETGKLKGRPGKISGDALNHKDVQEILKKVEGGCLIIERAGELEKETAIKLGLLLQNDRSGVFVILEDTSKGIKKALSLDDSFASRFTEKINVPIFTNDELVAFAKSYSEELGYEIDEVAVLALYNRISRIQRLDQATTLTEVKEIVDEAIAREEHRGLKKAISILTASRYTDDDRILLRERDFE